MHVKPSPKIGRVSSSDAFLRKYGLRSKGTDKSFKNQLSSGCSACTGGDGKNL